MTHGSKIALSLTVALFWQAGPRQLLREMIAATTDQQRVRQSLIPARTAISASPNQKAGMLGPRRLTAVPISITTKRHADTRLDRIIPLRAGPHIAGPMVKSCRAPIGTPNTFWLTTGFSVLKCHLRDTNGCAMATTPSW